MRDNIHSLDVIRAFEAFYESPRPGEVYNLGGCRPNSCSVVEAIAAAEGLTGRKMSVSFVDENRKGDHICYISDMAKFRGHYPGWSISKSLNDIYNDLAHRRARRHHGGGVGITRYCYVLYGSWEHNASHWRPREMGKVLIERGVHVTYIVEDVPYNRTSLECTPANVVYVPRHKGQISATRRAVRGS